MGSDINPGRIQMSPMQRTKAALKKAGVIHQKVEYWNGFVKPHGIRVDLFNIIDIIALRGCILGIQVTGADLASHKKKIMEECKQNTIAWLANGGRLEVWGWRTLKKKRGGKAKVWKPRIVDVTFVNSGLVWEERK